jgi:hypothetical protein
MSTQEFTAESAHEIAHESAQEIAAEANAGTSPITCTLTTPGFAEQGGRWKRLAARAMTERAQTTHGLRMSFRPEAGVEDELRALLAVENECCPWATWTVRTDAGQITLDVRSTGVGIGSLHNMFTSLWPVTPDPAASGPAACCDGESA